MTREQLLFARIIERALIDTELGDKTEESREARDDAIEWFDNADVDGWFGFVCMCAGVDPTALLERYRAGLVDVRWLRRRDGAGC